MKMREKGDNNERQREREREKKGFGVALPFLSALGQRLLVPEFLSGDPRLDFEETSPVELSFPLP